MPAPATCWKPRWRLPTLLMWAGADRCVVPAGSAAFAAARQLREAGWIRGGERVVVLNTGAGIKYPDAITVVPQRLRRDGRIPA